MLGLRGRGMNPSLGFSGSLTPTIYPVFLCCLRIIIEYFQIVSVLFFKILLLVRKGLSVANKVNSLFS